MKIVINRCYGGFGLSEKAAAELAKLQGGHDSDIVSDNRADPLLVRVVESLGAEANGEDATLSVVEIPDGIEYTIEDYDGIEWVAEKHRTWK